MVIEVRTSQRILPGKIYVPQYGQLVHLYNGVLSVEAQPPAPAPGPIIDGCFRSLAREARDKSICVFLSGTAYDGIEGAKAVERNGGLVIVQDPATAKQPLTPVAIIANDDPSYILSPDAIIDRITRRLSE